MCGRFTLVADPNDLREAFPWLNIPEGINPRYNVAPSQPVAVIQTMEKTGSISSPGV